MLSNCEMYSQSTSNKECINYHRLLNFLKKKIWTKFESLQQTASKQIRAERNNINYLILLGKLVEYYYITKFSVALQCNINITKYFL